MAADDTSTINQLMELFLLSRKRGEWVNLSLESKDGKDSVNFSLGSPTGSPVGQPKTWTPGPASPWTWPPLPTWTRPVRRKTPSQWKRDEKRRKDFYAKKGAKVMKTEPSDNQNADVIMEEPADESDLSNIKEKDVGQDDRPAGAGLHSPIIQVDGSGDCDDQVLYKFVSHYHKEDIGYCLEELFPKKNFELVSCVKERPYQSADQQCTVAIRKIAGQDFSWPDGKHDQVFREVRRQ